MAPCAHLKAKNGLIIMLSIVCIVCNLLSFTYQYFVLLRGIVSPIHRVMYDQLFPLIQITSTNKVAYISTATDLYTH